MSTAWQWEQRFLSVVRPAIPWLPTPVFIPRADGVNAANIVGLAPVTLTPPLVSATYTVPGPVGAPVIAFPPNSPEDADFVAHECGHAAHECAARARDAVEGKGTAGTDIYAEVAAILSPGVVWPSSGPDLRDEWTAEAFRKSITGNTAQLRYPNPPGQVSPYPQAALLAYVQHMQEPRVVTAPPPAEPVIEWVGGVPSSNFMSGRNGKSVSLIVDHWTNSPMDSAIREFQRVGSIKSAHFIIGQAGRIVQLVALNDTAYHAGDFPVNTVSVGIEHEAGGVAGPPTLAQQHASAWLHAQLGDQYNLDLELGSTVKHHWDIVPTECPGTLDVAAIVEEANVMSFTADDRAMLKKVYDQLNAEGPRIWTQRLQDWLSKFFHSLPMFAAADYSGPDVTTNQPRK